VNKILGILASGIFIKPRPCWELES
jgi:hypothetical protein